MPHTGLHYGPDREPTTVAAATGTISTSAITMTALGFSAANLAAAKRAVFSVSGDSVRFRYDGTAPTATVGISLDNAVGELTAIVLGTDNLTALQFIRSGAGDAVIFVQLEA